MRLARGGIAVFVAAGLCLAGCGSAAEREWRVAADADASAEDIIEAGGPADVATSGGQTVVTWQVQPEDDEGPYQGAWRLYGKDGDAVADGRFKQIFEASARITVHPHDDGFVLVSYVRNQPYLLNRDGDLRRPPKGTNIATLLGTYREADSYADLADWRMQLPHQKRLVRWNDMPTDSPQGMIVAGGELWVGLPRKQDYEPGRIAHSKTGRKPWAIETIPNPSGTAIDSESLTTSGGNLFAVAVKFGGGSNGDRLDVVSILRRPLTADGKWERVDATGIDDGPVATLTVAPRITSLPNGRLLASGEGAWLSKPDGGWAKVNLPKSDAPWPPSVGADGSRLWASGTHDLHYSDDEGKTWREFDR